MGIMLLCINTLMVLNFYPFPNIPKQFLIFEGLNDAPILKKVQQ
jgi:hypothetical protein